MPKSRLDQTLEFINKLHELSEVPGKLQRIIIRLVLPLVVGLMALWTFAKDLPGYVPVFLGLLAGVFPLIWLGSRWNASRKESISGKPQPRAVGGKAEDTDGPLDLRYWVDEKYLMLAVDCRRVGEPVQHCRLHLLSLKPFDNGRFIVDGESGSGIVFANKQIKPFKPEEVHLVLDRGDHFDIPVHGRPAGFLVKRWNKNFIWEVRLAISANGVEQYRPKPFYFSWPPLTLTDNPENEAK